jgi:hypothetical protein
MKRRTTNRGWFRAGFDPRRHTLTLEERRRGGKVAWRVYGYWQGEPGGSSTRRRKPSNSVDSSEDVPF